MKKLTERINKNAKTKVTFRAGELGSKGMWKGGLNCKLSYPLNFES